jgi:hypothetical protein
VAGIVDEADRVGSRLIQAPHQFAHTPKDGAAVRVLDWQNIEVLGAQRLPDNGNIVMRVLKDAN